METVEKSDAQNGGDLEEAEKIGADEAPETEARRRTNAACCRGGCDSGPPEVTGEVSNELVAADSSEAGCTGCHGGHWPRGGSHVEEVVDKPVEEKKND